MSLRRTGQTPAEFQADQLSALEDFAQRAIGGSDEGGGNESFGAGIIELGTDRDAAILAAKQDLNWLAALAIPEVFQFPYPPIFLAIWQMFQTAVEKKKGKDHLAIGIPRGFGKTIILKLYVLYLILFTDRQFILIVCNTQELAENFISDVADMLSSDNIIRLFGDYRFSLERDTLKLKKFSFRGRPIILAGAGAKTSLRGLNIKYVRPDVIIMDDMQSREEAESVVESVKTITWMIGTLLKAASPHRCLNIFVGNMYPFEGAILKKLKYNPAWISFICGAILEDGESVWPELKPVDELITELENDTALGHPEIFYSEVMNDEEAGTRSGVDISSIRGVPSRDLPDYHQAGFVIIDPSLGEKKSDDIAIGAVLLYDEKPILRQLEVGKFTPLEVIRKALSLALHYRLGAIIVESVAYQKSLIFWFNQVKEQLGIQGIDAYPIIPGRNKKNSRIIAALKQLVAKEILLHEDVRNQVIYQITHWNPLKTNNKDDILDIIAYIYQVINLYKYAIMSNIWIDIDSEQVDAAFTEQLTGIAF